MSGQGISGAKKGVYRAISAKQLYCHADDIAGRQEMREQDNLEQTRFTANSQQAVHPCRSQSEERRLIYSCLELLAGTMILLPAA